MVLEVEKVRLVYPQLQSWMLILNITKVVRKCAKFQKFRLQINSHFLDVFFLLFSLRVDIRGVISATRLWSQKLNPTVQEGQPIRR